MPLLLWLTLFTFITGPGQLIFGWINADARMKRHPGWFWSYLAWSILFYAGYKNVIARVGKIKEIAGESEWHITPRN